MCLKFAIGINFMCICCANGVVDIEAETPHGTCTYMDKSCIGGHHAYVAKDSCTPVINDACSGQSRREVLG